MKIGLEVLNSLHKNIKVFLYSFLILNSKLYFEVNKSYLTVTSQRAQDFIQVEKKNVKIGQESFPGCKIKYVSIS